MNQKSQPADEVEPKNMALIISITTLVIFLGIFISWLTGTGPKSLKCENSQVFFEGKCYDNTVVCGIENGSGQKKREGNDYGSCIALLCDNGFELLNGTCLPEIRKRILVLTGSFHTQSNKLGAYPAVIINKPIQGGAIKFTVDFLQSYKNGNYDNFIYGGKLDGSPAKPYNFGLNFFLGKGDQGQLSSYAYGYGGFFDAITVNGDGKIANNSTIGTNGVVGGNQIVGGYTWEIPIKNNVIFATKASEPINERTPDYQYKKLNILDYINNNVGSKIYIGGYLSNMNDEPGRKFTDIKSIEIEYLGGSGAIQKVS